MTPPLPARDLPESGPIDGPPALARLQADHRDGGSAVHLIYDEAVLIGRGEDTALRLDDPTISRRHAQLLRDPAGRWEVHDLRSRNGVWSGDQQVAIAPLTPSQPVRLGAYTLSLLPLIEGGSHEDSDFGNRTLSLSPDEATAISSLDQLSAPTLQPDHIRSLLDFGHRLMELDEVADRRAALCQVMLLPELRCRCGTLIRVRLDRPESPPVVLSPAVSRPGDPIEEPHVSRSVLRALAERRQPVMATNEATGSDAGERQMTDLSITPEQALLTVLAAPVRIEPEHMEVLYLVAPPEVGSAAWLTLIELAGRLYREAESAWQLRAAHAQQAATERELAQARRIQGRLIPDDPALPGLDADIWFQPCYSVGGDYTDILAMPDGRALLVLGDVAGKGLQAALVTASLHAMLHTAVADADADLATVLGRLNNHLCDYLPDGSFVTLVAAMLNRVTGEGTLCNAGHPPPFVLHPDGRVTELQSEGNLVLGCMPGELVCQDFRLEPGDTLAFYSDGLTEAVSPGGGMLEIPGLRDMFAQQHRGPAQQSLAQLRDGLQAALSAFQGDAHPTDDQTMLLVRRA